MVKPIYLSESDPVNQDEPEGDVEQEPVEAPHTVILMTADLGSSIFNMTTENCDPIQLFGAAKMLEMLAMEAFADMRAANIAAQSRIVTPGMQVPILSGRKRN